MNIRYDNYWVRFEDAKLIAQDKLIWGNVFLRPTDERENGEVVYERVEPTAVAQ